jgi:hypothetical protein
MMQERMSSTTVIDRYLRTDAWLVVCTCMLFWIVASKRTEQDEQVGPNQLRSFDTLCRKCTESKSRSSSEKNMFLVVLYRYRTLVLVYIIIN